MKKNAYIKVTVEPEIKRKFLAKAKDLGLSMTGFIEKLSNEPIIFLDSNARAMLEALKLSSKL